LDQRITLSLYGFARGNKVLSRFIGSFCRLSSLIFAVIYGLGGAWLILHDMHALFSYLAAPAAALLLSVLLRRLVKRPRPFAVLGIKRPDNRKDSFSCPSNHSASAAVIALAVMRIHPGFGACALVLALLTGSSRVFIGAHYPADVLAGYLLAGAVVYVQSRIL
jgi:membrane-associated phospholipid phosphatase